MHRIIKIIPGSNHRLTVHFDDGVEGTVDLTDQLYGPMFEELKNQTVFESVTLDEFGAPCWSNGADIAPDALYEDIRVKSDGYVS